MSTPARESIEQDIRRTVGMRALKEVRNIVDEDLHGEAVRKKWLRAFLRYGWIVLLLAAGLLAAGLLAHYFGVI